MKKSWSISVSLCRRLLGQAFEKNRALHLQGTPYGKKNPDFDKGETYSLPFEVDLCYREGDFKTKSINIEPDGTVFLRNEHSDIDLEKLSTNELEKLRSKLGDHILKNYIGIEYTCVKDIDNINDSMECDTETEPKSTAEKK